MPEDFNELFRKYPRDVQGLFQSFKDLFLTTEEMKNAIFASAKEGKHFEVKALPLIGPFRINTVAFGGGMVSFTTIYSRNGSFDTQIIRMDFRNFKLGTEIRFDRPDYYECCDWMFY